MYEISNIFKKQGELTWKGRLNSQGHKQILFNQWRKLPHFYVCKDATSSQNSLYLSSNANWPPKELLTSQVILTATWKNTTWERHRISEKEQPGRAAVDTGCEARQFTRRGAGTGPARWVDQSKVHTQTHVSKGLTFWPNTTETPPLATQPRAERHHQSFV